MVPSKRETKLRKEIFILFHKISLAVEVPSFKSIFNTTFWVRAFIPVFRKYIDESLASQDLTAPENNSSALKVKEELQALLNLLDVALLPEKHLKMGSHTLQLIIPLKKAIATVPTFVAEKGEAILKKQPRDSEKANSNAAKKQYRTPVIRRPKEDEAISIRKDEVMSMRVEVGEMDFASATFTFVPEEKSDSEQERELQETAQEPLMQNTFDQFRVLDKLEAAARAVLGTTAQNNTGEENSRTEDRGVADVYTADDINAADNISIAAAPVNDRAALDSAPVESDELERLLQSFENEDPLKQI